MSDFLNPSPTPRRALHEALDRGMVIAPGVYDGVTARLVEDAGFEAAYFTGFGATASLLGRPDIGLLTETEMADALRRLCAAVDVPLIADADTGYGGALNVVRTVHDYEQAGVGAIQLEDQVFPKRCGHMSGKEVIARDEAVAKVRAAVGARTDPDLLIIARTDAGAVEGVGEAIERAKAFADAGADILFVEAPPTREDIERIARELGDHRLLFNWVEGGRTEDVTIELVRDLGFRLVIFPISALLTVTRAVGGMLRQLRESGSTASYAGSMDTFDDVVSLMGLAQIRRIEDSFTRPGAGRTAD
ncbi:carboxyvinyl-carboxyphosphonate phosphorylmutase [Epidermidibacterium keratini]|uniref:Carboxyvinyl-carboxyphosphonate phosphorylmutase n=1 Tax=Epidermidibacterium keratini TaxID=1891644 RepID=A0A7L4YL25_9ACTN|nr:isocitrate lyase/PEP mutase family protein [Epidermidibacterium keratini]QHB99950.1 carboxyvinyl-carboxyphosphonate phosphorylmutase [Epidermidibacterium keratini]